jgi:homoserine kinase
VSAAGDTVTVERCQAPEIRVVEVTGRVTDLPAAQGENTASAAAAAMASALDLGSGFQIRLHKGIPLGSGMGGSAASAVGAVVALNQLLESPLPVEELYPFALVGEAVASGSLHGDNVAPSLVGGLTLVAPAENESIIRVPAPPELRVVLVHPELRIDTKASRAALPKQVPLATAVAQTANLAALISACFLGDLDLAGRSLRDVMIEPHRSGGIPGFDAVKAAAMAHGALGCSVSGAGPSVFAWFVGETLAATGCDAMVQAFSGAGVAAEGMISSVDGPGAHEVQTDAL